MSEETKVWKDRYLIEKELARGGFGVVYLARDQRLLSKPVVVKVLLEEVDLDPYVQKKFRQEIEALARIDHPGIVGVLDVGETPEGKPFLVMQFVEGATLHSQIGAGGMPLRHVGRLIRQIGQALTAAHDKGVLHRDLKPENIMLQTLGGGEVQAKVIDFGIAAVKNSLVDRTQLTSRIAGTLSYMAPEQVMGHTSLSSDLYSLGVIAFEMVTGVLPENSPLGVLKKPRELRPELSETAQAIILRALSYRPEERQSRIFEFSEGLAEALGVKSDHMVNLYSADFETPPLPRKVSSQRSRTEVATGAVATGTAPKSRVGLLLGIAAVAVAALGLGYYLRFPSTAPNSPEAAPQVQPAQQNIETPPPAKTPVPEPSKAATEPPPTTPPAADPKRAEPANNVVAPAPPPPAQPTPNGFRPPLAGPGRGNVAAALRQRATRLNNRQAAASRGFQNLVLPQNRRGNELRRESTTAGEEFQRVMNLALTALSNGDLPTAALNLDLADKAVARIETIIRRGPLPPRGQ